MPTRPRVIVASPTQAECDAIADWLLADGFDPVKKTSARAALDEIQSRSFDLLIADYAFSQRDGLHAIARLRNARTPAVIVGDDDHTARNQVEKMHALYLLRPLERALFRCTVTMAVLEGRPQRRSPRKAVNRFQAVVNGVPSYLVDVSNEGLRLEMPGERRPLLPPSFVVRVPLVGIAVSVQRMWTSMSPGEPRHQVMRCGVTLSENQPRAERAWRAFVDTIPAHGVHASDPLVIG